MRREGEEERRGGARADKRDWQPGSRSRWEWKTALGKSRESLESATHVFPQQRVQVFVHTPAPSGTAALATAVEQARLGPPVCRRAGRSCAVLLQGRRLHPVVKPGFAGLGHSPIRSPGGSPRRLTMGGGQQQGPWRSDSIASGPGGGQCRTGLSECSKAKTCTGDRHQRAGLLGQENGQGHILGSAPGCQKQQAMNSR